MILMHSLIEKLAYQKWENAGKPDGMAEHFWLEAESEYNSFFPPLGPFEPNEQYLKQAKKTEEFYAFMRGLWSWNDPKTWCHKVNNNDKI